MLRLTGEDSDERLPKLALNQIPCFACCILLAGILGACSMDTVPAGLEHTATGTGPVVRFTLTPRHFDIPMPNDVLSTSDATSGSGLRLNLSTRAASNIEQEILLDLNRRDGFGTFATISVAFDKHEAGDGRPALDLGKLVRLQTSDNYDFADDAVYLVNLRTGVPVPCELGQGSFSYILDDKAQYSKNDPRSLEPVLLWETADETVDPKDATFAPGRTQDGSITGRTTYRPEWDHDFDGIIDRPNLLNRNACPNQIEVELASSETRESLETLRDQCLADHLLSWYERETDTLLIRPLLPLQERTQYAVVLTDRLTSPDGEPIRSPFDFVYHPSQASAVEKLRQHLSDSELSGYYGDIGATGLEHVAFAWSFTTQSVTEDVQALRYGLHGSGPLARLAADSEPEVEVLRALGLVDLDALEQGGSEPDHWQAEPACSAAGPAPVAASMSAITDALALLVKSTLALDAAESAAVAETWQHISHLTFGSFESPRLLSGTGTSASFDVGVLNGDRNPASRERVTFLAAIPKQTSGQEQPFPVVWYAHGHARSFVESLLFAGTLAEQGLATLSINAPLHGVSLDAGTEAALDALFEQACAAPLNSALHRGRARDTDGDARLDSGSGWYDARVFHTRDLVRQTVVDALQLFRSLELLETNGAADFDGDGRNDLSTAGGVSAWGQSVGGAVATIAASVEPSITALAVGSSNAAFSDLLATTSSPLIVSEALLTILGPLVIGTPVSELVASGTLTQCQSGEVSLRFVLPAPGRPVELEFGCFDPVTATSGRGLESGASVLLTNGDNGQVRCTRMDSEGRFRVSIPTSVGDRLELQVWDQPNAVDSYHPDTGCNVDDSGVNRIALVNAWQLPANYRGQAFAPNMRLLAPIDGLGRQRQTPSLRRLFELMSHGFSAADPASFAAPLTLGGRNSPTKPILSYVTAGDTTSPVSGGIALARAFGLVPFLRPHSDSQYPDYADFVTPAELFSQLANKTPNRLLVDTHVVEGVARLERHPPAETCGHNEPPAAEGSDVCHPPCTMDDQSSCLSHQECQAGRCAAAAVDTRTCADFLFDVDALAEGKTGLNQRQSTVPLRLARVAAREGDPLKIWRPRLQAAPFSSDDFGFSAEEPLRAHVQAYLHPLGTHALGAPERCARFASSLYMARLVARFFSSHGQDIYYLSHPATHQCLAESELCASLTQ